MIQPIHTSIRPTATLPSEMAFLDYRSMPAIYEPFCPLIIKIQEWYGTHYLRIAYILCTTWHVQFIGACMLQQSREEADRRSTVAQTMHKLRNLHCNHLSQLVCFSGKGNGLTLVRIMWSYSLHWGIRHVHILRCWPKYIPGAVRLTHWVTRLSTPKVEDLFSWCKCNSYETNILWDGSLLHKACNRWQTPWNEWSMVIVALKQLTEFTSMYYIFNRCDKY